MVDDSCSPRLPLAVAIGALTSAQSSRPAASRASPLRIRERFDSRSRSEAVQLHARGAEEVDFTIAPTSSSIRRARSCSKRAPLKTVISRATARQLPRCSDRDQPLLPQLAAAGYAPADITFSLCRTTTPTTRPTRTRLRAPTWIVQKAERDFMFADKPQGIIQPAQYSALKKRQDEAAER